MKNFKTLFFLLFAGFVANAQQATLSAGGETTGAGGSTSYSIGQIAFLYSSSSTGNVSQGVQQPFGITTLSGEEFSQISLQMLVYPNPTTSLVNLKIENFDLQELTYQLTDMNGRLITNQKISSSETNISFDDLSTAIYVLSVNDQNKALKTFKIVKN